MITMARCQTAGIVLATVARAALPGPLRRFGRR